MLRSQEITGSAQVLRRWLRAGKIKGIKNEDLQGSWLIPDSELEGFISRYTKARERKRTAEYLCLRVEELLQMKSLINIPLFQRNFIWLESTQSKFILTLLELSSSLSTMYLAQDGNGYILVDGRQRLETVFRFAEGKLNLKYGGDTSLDVIGKDFDQLSDDLQRRFLDGTINVAVLKNYTFNELSEMFVRLNIHTPLK